ncbi:MAG: ABC transporter permease, partial [Alphaproteobacteria bacterium]|nr:ABC transporter permease [Alphaproteobacteria bacterium]
MIRRLIASRLAAFGAGVLALVGTMAMLAPVLVPHDPAAQDILSRLLPPLTRSDVGFHVLGTDALGRDLLSRLIMGSRVSLLVGVAAVAVSCLLGVTIGLAAGWDDHRLG